MSAAERTAKRKQLGVLQRQLWTATSYELRLALRTQIRGVVLELKKARLTRAERAELHAKITQMRRALRAAPTGAERAAITAQVKTLTDQLRCTVAG